MVGTRIALSVFSAVLISAHFLRSGQILLTTLCLFAPLLFLVRRRLSLTALQLFSYATSAVWIYTLAQLVMLRVAHGQPWKAAAMILGSVALVSLLSGLLLNGAAIRARYPLAAKENSN